jgi:DNA-binding MarR family transcriptional regulator
LPERNLPAHYSVVMDHMEAIGEAWQRERPDVDVAALVLLGRLLRAAALADAELARGLSAHHLQPGWFDLLAALRRAGPPYVLRPGELMRATMLSSAGMTKRLDRLVDAGLVERRPDPDDRRGTQVLLTAAGRRTIDDALPVHVANEERLLARLSEREQRTLGKLLEKLLAPLESADESS